MRKGLEAYFTVLIEALWPKRRILEVYLNIAEFGDGIYGARCRERTLLPQDAGAARRARIRAAGCGAAESRAITSIAAVTCSSVPTWIERQAAQLGGPAYLPR